MDTQLKSWFVIDFANVDIEDEEAFADFIKQWNPDKSPPHTVPEWFYIFTMVNEVRKTRAEELELMPLLVSYRKLFITYQNEIRNYLENFKETAIQNAKSDERTFLNGKILIERIVSDDLIKTLAEKLSKVHFTIKTVPTPSSSAFSTQVIVPDLTEFETCLFYDFYQYVTANSTLLVCEQCNNYISNPSKSQFTNAKRGLATLHATEKCRDAYNRNKDSERNRKKYRKKKELIR